MTDSGNTLDEREDIPDVRNDDVNAPAAIADVVDDGPQRDAPSDTPGIDVSADVAPEHGGEA